jgi:hypothetical protein
LGCYPSDLLSKYLSISLYIQGIVNFFEWPDSANCFVDISMSRTCAQTLRWSIKFIVSN